MGKMISNQEPDCKPSIFKSDQNSYFSSCWDLSNDLPILAPLP
jgi:hypothetical protein